MRRVVVHGSIVLTVFAHLLLTSCAPLAESIDHVKEELSPVSVDFNKYADSGFLFSTYPYQGKYKTLGIVYATAFPEATLLDKKAGKGENDFSVTDYDWSIRSQKGKYLFDTLYARAKALNANALVDIKIESRVRNYNSTYGSFLPLSGIEVIGIAIKRLD